MDFKDLTKARYSVRKFSDKAVEKSVLDQILEAGRLAPTAKNLQPQRIYIMQSNEALEKINALCPCIYGAKTVFLFTYDKEEDWKNALEEGVHSGEQDVSIVATHMMMQATDLGVGTLWINKFPNSETEKAFNLPASERSVLLMAVGYERDDCRPASLHTIRKPIEELVRYL
ncbi:MAG: nitroreductase family protein [Bacteroidaceae bacterium]|nr:nitroreductase family protein [Bacteroidaceae bacterium]